MWVLFTWCFMGLSTLFGTNSLPLKMGVGGGGRKGKLNAFAKSIHQRQPAQSSQADVGRNFPLFRFEEYHGVSSHIRVYPSTGLHGYSTIKMTIKGSLKLLAI